MEKNGSYKDLEVLVRTVTPEIAAGMLEENTNNRALNDKRVRELSAAMLRGEWKMNGDSICFSDQRLLDGQHRLASVVHSGISIKTLCVRGLPDDVFDTIDQGSRRSHGDIVGLKGIQNSYTIAAAIKWVDKYYTSRVFTTTAYTPSQILDLLDEHPKLGESFRYSSGAKGLMPGSMMMAAHYLFSRNGDNKDAADEFIGKLISGSELAEGTGIYVLREMLLKNNQAKTKFKAAYIFALTIKAWNAWRTDAYVKILRFQTDSETVPVIK